MEARAMIRECVVCGAEFEGHPNAKACSEECRTRLKRVAWLKWRAANGPKAAKRKAAERLRAKMAGPKRECIICGVDITALYGNRKVCSDACMVKNRSKNEKVRRKGVFRNCDICGKAFRVVSSDKTCSPACNRVRQDVLKVKNKPRLLAYDRARYWRNREKRLAEVKMYRARERAELKVYREFKTKGMEMFQ